MKPGQHGCGFREDNEKDVEELKTYLFLCMTYFPAAYLCYEISEKDYIKCDAVSETLKIIQKLHNQKSTAVFCHINENQENQEEK